MHLQYIYIAWPRFLEKKRLYTFKACRHTTAPRPMATFFWKARCPGWLEPWRASKRSILPECNQQSPKILFVCLYIQNFYSYITFIFFSFWHTHTHAEPVPKKLSIFPLSLWPWKVYPRGTEDWCGGSLFPTGFARWVVASEVDTEVGRDLTAASSKHAEKNLNFWHLPFADHGFKQSTPCDLLFVC